MERPSEWTSGSKARQRRTIGGYIHFRLKLMANLTDCLISNYCSAELPLLMLLELRLLLPHTGAPFKLAIFLFHCDWLCTQQKALKHPKGATTHTHTLGDTVNDTHTILNERPFFSAELCTHRESEQNARMRITKRPPPPTPKLKYSGGGVNSGTK